MTKTSPDAQLSNKAAQRHLLTNCLPILGTALLLCWLSEDSPASWRLLFQIGTQFSALWTTRGASLLLPFLILLVQSLLMGLAWVLLIWLAIREGRAFFALRSGVQPDTVFQGSSLASQSQPLLLQSQQPVAILPPQQESRVPAPAPAQDLSFSFDQGLAASSSLEAALGNPFEDPLSMLKNARPAETPFRRSEHKQASLSQRRLVPAPSQPEEQQENPDASVLEHQQTVEGHFSSILNDMGFVIRQPVDQEVTAGSREQQAGEGQQETEEESVPLSDQLGNPFEEDELVDPSSDALYVPGDPFDVKQEVFDIFATATRPSDAQTSATHALTADSLMEGNQRTLDMADGEFVYGHPFEGPLPEVFRHDADLRRSVMEQIAEEREQQPAKHKQESSANSEKKPVKRSPRKKTS